MRNYEIKIHVDMNATEQEVTQGAMPSADGSFRIVIGRESGQSIDQCEQALFAVNYPAIREALSRRHEAWRAQSSNFRKDGTHGYGEA